MTSKFNYVEIGNEGRRTIESQIEQSRALELVPEIERFNEAHAPENYRILLSV